MKMIKKGGVKQEMSVGGVAERSGLAVSAIHFYESKGLISSRRNNGNHRRYDRGVLRKLAVIKVAQRAGVPLAEIKLHMSSLPKRKTINAEDWAKLAEHWRQDLDTRIEQLTLMRDLMSKCIGCGCLSVKDCELMNPKDELAEKSKGAYFFEVSQE